jgi:hypothetical protein
MLDGGKGRARNKSTKDEVLFLPFDLNPPNLMSLLIDQLYDLLTL